MKKWLYMNTRSMTPISAKKVEEFRQVIDLFWASFQTYRSYFKILYFDGMSVYHIFSRYQCGFRKWQKQTSKSVHITSCSEIMYEIYRRTPVLKCDFNKVAKQLYWNHTSECVLFCKFDAYFQNTYS